MILGCDGLWEVSKLFVCGFAVLYKNISFCLYISKFAAHTQCNRFQVFGPSDAVGFVQKLLKEGLHVSTVSRRLVKEAVKERRCKDNCTAIVIVFKRV
jgi:hypothetical protein